VRGGPDAPKAPGSPGAASVGGVSVCVVGSINLDRVLRAPRIPAPGETLLGTGVAPFPGGKGNNQAVAAARSGAAVVLVGALGRDADGEALLDGMRSAGVEPLVRRMDRPTGTAWITVADDGENTIVVVPGANAALLDLGEHELAAVRAAGVVLLQQEVPAATVRAAASAGAGAGATVVLNAAPSRSREELPLDAVSVLVVNEHEAHDLVGSGDLPGAAAGALLSLVPAAVVTLGAEGAVVAVRGAEPVRVPARRVPVTDTTGAGDAFCGALAAELDRSGARGVPGAEALVAAARYASDVAALAVQRDGAQAGIPTRAEVEAIFGDGGPSPDEAGR
jgi:ribokinase